MYAVKSQISLHGFNEEEGVIIVKAREGESKIREEEIEEVLEERGGEIALILMSGVQYYTGQLFPIERITRMAQKKGIIVGWDLAHAVGNVPLKLNEWGVDFASWCSYKYLNSGPGGIGGAFIHEKHANRKGKRLSGWWGHNFSTRFEMDALTFQPIEGADGFRISNPPVFQLAAHLASLDIFMEAGMENLRKKSKLLTGFLEYLLRTQLKERVKILTPMEEEERGCQLSLFFEKDVKHLNHFLKEKGIICDVRKPNVIRVSPAPLYNSFSDVWKFYINLHHYFSNLTN